MSLFFVAILLIFSSCSFFTGWQNLDLDVFVISVPNNWHFMPVKAIDSFVGKIEGDNLHLIFDYSKQGFVGCPTPTEKEYLDALWFTIYRFPGDARESFSMPEGQLPLKIAAARRLAAEKSFSQATKNDTSVIFVKEKYIGRKQDKKPDYYAIVNYSGKSDTIPVYIPEEIKRQNIKADTNGKYITKTILPKIPGKGTTGIFVYRTDSDFTFLLQGENLSKQNQELAEKAFKTIKFR
jgi:hypothetical protein